MSGAVHPCVHAPTDVLFDVADCSVAVRFLGTEVETQTVLRHLLVSSGPVIAHPWCEAIQVPVGTEASCKRSIRMALGRVVGA